MKISREIFQTHNPNNDHYDRIRMMYFYPLTQHLGEISGSVASRSIVPTVIAAV